jgi:hypothetical protein
MQILLLLGCQSILYGKLAAFAIAKIFMINSCPRFIKKDGDSIDPASVIA